MTLKKFWMTYGLIAAVFAGTPALAAKAKNKTSRGTSAAPAKDSCEGKLKKLVEQTAKAMGLKDSIGFEISKVDEKEQTNPDEILYASTVFRVKEGYIADSSAEVAVLANNAREKCQVTRMTVSIGR